MSADMEGLLRCVLLCLLCFPCRANERPDITNFTYRVCEDTPVDVVAFTVAATDPDNDPLTFSISGVNAGFFRIEANTGRVTVLRELDKESNDVMVLTVTVSDGIPSNTITKDINIVLEEANDNRPIFEDASYDIRLPENTPVGSSLFTVKATDADFTVAGVVSYSLGEITPSSGVGLFRIGSNTGVVTLLGNLNYTGLSTFYRLEINATDGGGRCYYDEINYFSSLAYSFITVEDVPDLDPQFLGVPYLERVEENSPIGSTVCKVTALDQDRGINDDIIYSIEAATVAGLFAIAPDTGVITVSSEIDREEFGDDDSVTLTVKARESNLNIHGVFASTTTNVVINIIDVNDNKPEFYKCGLSCVKETHFTEEVFENTLGSISINMTVRDLDKISNTKLTLGGANKDVFSVQPQFTMSDSTVQLVVKQLEKLDYEKTKQIVVEVIATDQDDTSFQSTATVTINIKDTNDNSPKFPQSTYRLNVTEHADVGTEVANITAEDPDTMDQGKLTYGLLPDSIRMYFDVDEYAGVIRVKNKDLLDREVRSLHSATLEARDTEGKPGTTVLEITVLDINDQPPVFNRDSYREFVKEGGQLELKIEATDADDPDTENSKIVYSIEESKYSDNFTIDPDTGVLRNSGELDREALDPELDGKIELTINATDKGTPPLSDSVLVVIDVEDINDNKPQFAELSYEFSVKEGEKGAFVGSVTAVDLDQTRDFNRISFGITDGSFGSFIIRTYAMEQGYRGNITVDPDIELDYESERKQFTLRVEAADLEQLSAEVTVVVNVNDVNDERPEFMPTPSIRVKENTTIVDAVGRFMAKDKDTNHSLVYELESIECRCKEDMKPCDYFILDPTGEVRVNPEVIVDYEECDQVVLEAQVVDVYTEKGENNSAQAGRMEINIEDINDNIPEFIYSDSVFIVVSETASKGKSVAEVTATDRDSGIFRQIDFEVTEVKFKDNNNHTEGIRVPFEAVTTQQKDIYIGIIQTTGTLDAKLKGRYLVSVKAADSGGLFSSTTLEIFTVDETFQVELEFTSSVGDVEAKIDDIRRALSAATKTSVDIVSIQANNNEETRASTGTVVVAYFVYSNGTALTSDEVEKMISDPEHYFVLEGLGLANIGTAPVIETSDPVKYYVLPSLLGGLIIVLAILTTSLLCTRRNYRRRLKAAKAMNSAAMVNSDNQKSSAVVPGSNQYTMEGANPVLNLNIDSTMFMDLGEEESSDVDKVSVNSLDWNDDKINPEKDSKQFMNMIQEEEEDEYEGEGAPPKYIEPLDAVIALRGQKKNNPLQGYSNPAFSTTDL